MTAETAPRIPFLQRPNPPSRAPPPPFLCSLRLERVKVHAALVEHVHLQHAVRQSRCARPGCSRRHDGSILLAARAAMIMASWLSSLLVTALPVKACSVKLVCVLSPLFHAATL